MKFDVPSESGRFCKVAALLTENAAEIFVVTELGDSGILSESAALESELVETSDFDESERS